MGHKKTCFVVVGEVNWKEQEDKCDKKQSYGNKEGCVIRLYYIKGDELMKTKEINTNPKGN